MVLWILTTAWATTYNVYSGEDLFGVLDGLVAGDEVIVHAGTYSTQQSGGSWLRQYNWQGTSTDPIVVHAAPGAGVLIEGDPGGSQNILNLEGQYWTFEGFELRYGSHGIRLYNSAHVTLENLEIHDTGDVGLSANIGGQLFEDITLRGNHIHDTGGTGECFYLGCNDDGCQFFDSLVEYNWCHDTLSTSQGDGIEIKTGSYNNIVRHNVVHDVNYPGITMYGAMGRGNNQVYGNVVWNSNDNGIQVVNEVTVANNIVINSGNNGIQIKASQGETPHDLTIVNNTVDSAGDACFRGNDFSGATDGTVANNVFHCPGANGTRLPAGAGAIAFQTNAVAGNDEAGGGIGVDLTAVLNAAGLDYYPSAGGVLVDGGTAVGSVTDDFNCTARAGTMDIGAYDVSSATNPGWVPTPGFKTCAAMTGTGTGTTGTATGTGTGTGAGTGSGTGGGTGSGTGAGTGTGTATGGTDTGAGDEKGCGCDTGSGAAGWLALVALLGVRRR